jgi:hypothetical protein
MKKADMKRIIEIDEKIFELLNDNLQSAAKQIENIEQGKKTSFNESFNEVCKIVGNSTHVLELVKERKRLKCSKLKNKGEFN